MNPLERVLRRVDAFQQRHTRLAFLVAVSKKFGDDRAGRWAALIAYDAFIAVFPLLLLLVTLLGFLADRYPSIHDALLDSALRDFPIIGQQLAENVEPLRGNSFAVGIGALLLLWGSRGLSEAGQLAMAEVWNVPGVTRPGFFPRMLRSLAFVAALGLGVALTTVVSALAAFVPGPIGTRALAQLGTVAVNVALLIVLFRVLTPHIATRALAPGAAIAGVGWSVMQLLGALLVGHQLRHASHLYGYFGSVLGLVWWLFLTAQLTLYAAEINVVRARRLWPRSLAPPPLTRADREVHDAIAQENERRPEQDVRSDWQESA